MRDIQLEKEKKNRSGVDVGETDVHHMHWLLPPRSVCNLESHGSFNPLSLRRCHEKLAGAAT